LERHLRFPGCASSTLSATKSKNGKTGVSNLVNFSFSIGGKAKPSKMLGLKKGSTDNSIES
jgi:hypothetical protein